MTADDGLTEAEKKVIAEEAYKKVAAEKESFKQKLLEEKVAEARKNQISEIATEADKELPKAILKDKNPDIFAKAQKILEAEDPLYFICKTIEKIHKGDYGLIALNYCIGLSPWLTGKPLHSYPVGGSGKGKSDISSKVLLAFPEDAYVVLTSLSSKALYYAYKDGKLQQRQIILFDDVRIDENGIDTLKAFTGGNLIKPNLWTVDEKRKSLSVRVEGVYSVFLTSVNPLNDTQLKNRFIIQNPDESIDQDNRVWEYQDGTLRRSSETLSIDKDEDFSIARMITSILISNVDDILIPFKIEWTDKKDRRLYPFFLQLLKTIAKIYRFQRKVVNGKIVATKGDLEIASLIWDNIQKFQVTKSSQNTQKVLEALNGIYIKEEGLGYSEIGKKIKLSTTPVKNAVYELEAMGLVNTDLEGKKKIIWLSDSPDLKRLSANKTDNRASFGGFDLSVLSSLVPEADIESYINTPPHETIRRFIENRYTETTNDSPKEEKTEKTDETSGGINNISSYKCWLHPDKEAVCKYFDGVYKKEFYGCEECKTKINKTI